MRLRQSPSFCLGQANGFSVALMWMSNTNTLPPHKKVSWGGTASWKELLLNTHEKCMCVRADSWIDSLITLHEVYLSQPWRKHWLKHSWCSRLTAQHRHVCSPSVCTHVCVWVCKAQVSGVITGGETRVHFLSRCPIHSSLSEECLFTRDVTLNTWPHLGQLTHMHVTRTSPYEAH